MHAQVLEPGQAAQARRDGAAELVVVEPAVKTTSDSALCHCGAINMYAQLLQPSQAAQAGRDGAAELVGVESPAHAGGRAISASCAQYGGAQRGAFTHRYVSTPVPLQDAPVNEQKLVAFPAAAALQPELFVHPVPLVEL